MSRETVDRWSDHGHCGNWNMGTPGHVKSTVNINHLQKRDERSLIITINLTSGSSQSRVIRDVVLASSPDSRPSWPRTSERATCSGLRGGSMGSTSIESICSHCSSVSTEGSSITTGVSHCKGGHGAPAMVDARHMAISAWFT